MNRMSASEYRGNEFATAWQPDIGSQSDGACLTVPGSPRRVANGLGEELASAAATYGAFEWVALGYLTISSALIVIFAANLAYPLRLLSVQMLVWLLIAALCCANAIAWFSLTERTDRNECPTVTLTLWC